VWLRTLGIEPVVTHVVAGEASKARVQVLVDEQCTGQAWPGRLILRALPEDSTAERHRDKSSEKRAKDKPKTKDLTKAWDADDGWHD